ncbi:MAG TPA: carbon-nitrogen hydrolase family protein [Candidatus Bathyarchaeia archaeon]|nr:carbon-nitrogen hydrolase family protein [Candidatus Bathyarchaeia archaeon]
MHLSVAAAQLALGKDSYDRAISDARLAVLTAAQNGAKIVCLPEHWLLEYRDRIGEAIVELSRAALENKIFVVTGANYIKSDTGQTRIRSQLIDSNGTVRGIQDKVHLFLGEKKSASPGNSFELFETEFARIGITICYDNAFPESSRTLALKNVDLLFVPSRIVSQGMEPWLLYLKTRALENRLPIIAPNVTSPPTYNGGSVIIDLEVDPSTNVVYPKIIAQAKDEEKVLLADVDVEQARELRKKRLAERLPSAYSLS